MHGRKAERNDEELEDVGILGSMAGSFFDFQDELTNIKRAARSPKGVAAPDAQTPAILTVSQLTGQIDRVLKGGFPASIVVKGEVSNFRLHTGSGHAYFTLKDSSACLNCVMFKSDFVRVKFEPGDGMELLATGRLGVYAQRGSYQFYVTRLEPLGQGALELAFRQLCAKLEAEGLFAAERKKALPRYPRRIAIVTSRETAALQDILKVLRRFCCAQVLLYHVPVQGEGAALQIASALRDLSEHSDQLGGIDVILLARGGGSLEDLWQFNEEIVARAIVASRIPVITGIGHEVDVSIADLVADHHAHTPTEAAQVAIAHWRTAGDELADAGVRLANGMRAVVNDARSHLAQVDRHEFFRRPMDIVADRRQRVDDLDESLGVAVREHLSRCRQRLNESVVRMADRSPRHLLAEKRERLAQLELALGRHHPSQQIGLAAARLLSTRQRLGLAMRNVIKTQMSHVDLLQRHLNAVGPDQVLARGYSITTLKKGGVIVRSKSQVKGGQRLVTRVSDGEVESVAEDPNQPTLFE